jgi:hypothetical protein
LIDAELPFGFIEEEKRLELKAEPQRLPAAHGEILYRQKLGRSEAHRLELRNVETNQVIAWHQFPLTMASRRAAEAGTVAALTVDAVGEGIEVDGFGEGLS